MFQNILYISAVQATGFTGLISTGPLAKCLQFLLKYSLKNKTLAHHLWHRAQNLSFVIFGFFVESYSTLHLLQNTFTESKYLVSNW